MEKIILTGDRPTGRLHIGHYVGSLRRRVQLQNSGEFDKIFKSLKSAWLNSLLNDICTLNILVFKESISLSKRIPPL